jgi:hypothetical protein
MKYLGNKTKTEGVQFVFQRECGSRPVHTPAVPVLNPQSNAKDQIG